MGHAKSFFKIIDTNFRFGGVNKVDYQYNKKENKLITTRIHNSRNGDKSFSNFCVSVRGSLHKESVYEKRKTQHSLEEAYHIRKPLESIQTEKQVLKIVDPVVRASVLEAIDSAGGFQGDTVPRNAFFHVDNDGFKIHGLIICLNILL